MKRNSRYSNLGEYVKSCCRKYSSHTALQIRRGFAVDRFSYSRMYEMSRRFASYLVQLNVKHGEMVLIWGPNMPEWVIALLGALMAGAVAVPVSMHASPETVDEYIRQTKAKLLIRSKFVVDKNRAGPRLIELEAIVSLAEKTHNTKLPTVRVGDLAEILYTSGTTGDPAGVMLTHQNILEGLEGLKLLVPPSNEYRLLSILPLSHALEQLVGVFTVFRFGATVYYLPRINPVVILRSLKHYRITHVIAVPELLKVMWNSVEFQAQQKGSLGKLRFALQLAPYLPMRLRRILFSDIHRAFGGRLKVFATAGAPLDRWVGENWEKVGIFVIEGYGLTETSAALTANQIRAKKIGSVGRVLPGVEMKLTDDGEILTKGLNVTSGYFKNTKKTSDSFTKDGYFRTGDVGYLDKEGFVYLTGRKKFKIVTPTGEKVYPEDVERSLNDHPAVKESCVIGIKKGAGEIVHASIILKKDVDPATVISEVNAKLESHQTILQWSVWPDDDYPRTRSLKKDRNKVKAHILGLSEESKVSLRGQTGAMPETDTLVKILSAVSSIDSAHINDSQKLVFDLHFDSLRRVTLISMIEEELGVTLDEKDIDEKTTVLKLRKLVKEGRKTADLQEYPTWPLETPIVWLRDILFTYFWFPLFWPLFPRIRVENPEIVRSIKSPSIVVFNHVGHLEASMILARLPRSFRRYSATLAESRVYTTRLAKFHMYFTACAFPVDTTGGPVRHSLEFSAGMLERGWNLVLSPEGMISPDGTLQPFKHGTGVLAIETGVPVYPVKVKGYREAMFKLLPKMIDIPRPWGHLSLVFGKPLHFDNTVSYESATEQIRKAIEDL